VPWTKNLHTRNISPLKPYLLMAIAICVVAVSGCLCALLLTLRATVADIPAQIQATRSALVDQIATLRISTLADIDAQAKTMRSTAVNQLTVIRKDALAEAEAYRTMADRQLTATRADLRLSVDASIAKLVGPIEGVRFDLHPVLANAAAFEVHADKALVDLHPQMLGLIAASKVTAGETAQTMRTVRDAAPRFAATSEVTNEQIAGVATDLHKLADKFTGPMTLKQKIWEGIKVGAMFFRP